MYRMAIMGVINISAQHAAEMDDLYSILRSNVQSKATNSKIRLPGREKVNHLAPHHGLAKDTQKDPQ